MEFKKYCSIENTYREKEIEPIVEGIKEGRISDSFIVLEKIHGCNFQFVCDGESLEVGKRTSFFIEDDNFFSANKLKEIYRDSIFRIYDMLSVRYKKLKQVHVFGEMFGGGYGMEKSDVKKINKGIQYHPDHVFMCFDMFVTTDDMGMWLFEDDVETICVRNGILTVPAIFRGTFDECLKFDPIFKTKVPKMFGLAPIKDNFAEGVVIKGVKNQKCGRHRIVLKNKNPNFKEKASKLTKIKKPKELTEEHMALLTELMRYVNENRMETLISKIGIPKLSEFNKVRGLYIKDVLEDFYKDNKDADTDMVKELVKKNFGKEVANFMRDDGRWVNLCDGGQDEE